MSAARVVARRPRHGCVPCRRLLGNVPALQSPGAATSSGSLGATASMGDMPVRAERRRRKHCAFFVGGRHPVAFTIPQGKPASLALPSWQSEHPVSFNGPLSRRRIEVLSKSYVPARGGIAG